MRFPVIAVAASIALTTSASAQEGFLIEKFGLLGFGRMFTNDAYGDRRDRWRTGSYTFSIMTGRGWDGERPSAPGAVVEYRLRSEIIAPSALNGPGSDDRAYVGSLSAGVHTHYKLSDYQISAGADLMVLGPQTQLSKLQDDIHRWFSLPRVDANVEANQLPNMVRLSGVLDVARQFEVSSNVTLRPFVETRVGVEDVARAGADMILGTASKRDLLLRDVVSGQLYKGVEYGDRGWTFTLGGDVAHVSDSLYFPDSYGTTPIDVIYRARAGAEFQWSERASLYYGATYLSEEYEGQPNGQVVGSLRLNFNF